jgi:hypothetical protein
MTLEGAWQQRFPSEKPEFIAKMMQQTWDALMARKLPKYNATCKEPHLTEGLTLLLNSLCIDKGLAGQFFYETPNAAFDMHTTGEIINRRRSDITYYSSVLGLNLTFEFKKLKPDSKSHRTYCQEGVLRFVQGKYSADQPLAFMVGMVDPNHKTACINGIQTAMNKDATLQMQGTIVQPSTLFPQLAEFDSVHARTSDPPISLSHLLFLY